ncbi:hypothetical protein N9L68_02345 [bacterium]|nr:hypothetical protein [bacterium]
MWPRVATATGPRDGLLERERVATMGLPVGRTRLARSACSRTHRTPGSVLIPRTRTAAARKRRGMAAVRPRRLERAHRIGRRSVKLARRYQKGQAALRGPASFLGVIGWRGIGRHATMMSPPALDNCDARLRGLFGRGAR